MKTTKLMIKAHPHEPLCDSDKLAAAIAEIHICAQACTACADACLAEKNVADLIGCIRSDLDCADICRTTGAVLSRLTQPDTELVRSLLQTCAVACGACAEECEKHADMHQHCKLCGAACRSCEKECVNLLEVIR